MNRPNPTPEAYPNLFAPMKVGGVELRNWIIMDSMHTRLEPKVDGIAKQVAFLRERVRGETALIVTG